MVYAKLGIRNRLFVNSDPPEKVVDRIITEYEKDYKIFGRKENSKSDRRRMETNLSQKICNDG